MIKPPIFQPEGIMAEDVRSVIPELQANGEVEGVRAWDTAIKHADAACPLVRSILVSHRAWPQAAAGGAVWFLLLVEKLAPRLVFC